MKKQYVNGSLLQNDTWSTSMIKELTLSKIHDLPTYTDKTAPRKFARRFALAAAAVILALALATTALAVSGKIDFGSFLDSIFNSLFSNKEAAPFVQTGDGITIHTDMQSDDGEVTIVPIAAFIDTAKDSLYLELQITDTMGGRLSDSLVVLVSNDLADDTVGFSVDTFDYGAASVRFVDNNTIIARLHIRRQNVDNAGNTTVRIEAIASGLKAFDWQPTQFNIGEHIGMESPVVVSGAEFAEITGITVGDNGWLRVSYRDTDPAVHGWGSGALGLMKPNGEIIWDCLNQVDVSTQVRQNVYELRDTDPNDLTLVWSGSRAEYTITGNWEFTVSGENALHERTISGEFEGHRAEVELGATSIEFTFFTDDIDRAFQYDGKADDAVVIHLTDGSIIYPILSFIGRSNDTIGPTITTFGYVMDFVDPVDVESVTFYGVTIGG